MNVPIRADGLQLDEQRRFQRGFWVAERIGWAGFCVVILVALAGLTGRGGWFGSIDLHAAALSAEVPRVARRGEAVTVLLTLTGKPPAPDVRIEGSLLDRFDLTGTVPTPLQSAAIGGGVAFRFATVGASKQELRFHLRARRSGIATVAFRAGPDTLRARLLVLP